MTQPSMFPEIEADQVVELPPPPRPELWVVLALREGIWTIPSSIRVDLPATSREGAERAANKLHASWAHKRLVRIPGEKP
jgi:hypothetical protein